MVKCSENKESSEQAGNCGCNNGPELFLSCGDAFHGREEDRNQSDAGCDEEKTLNEDSNRAEF